MKNKLTVTISILAYNEETLIESLLTSVLSQNMENFILKEINVYSDGSTDKTVELVKSNFPHVGVQDFKNNKGKNFRINQIMHGFSSDLLLQLDADMQLKDRNVFLNLIKPFYRLPHVGITCAYHKANAPKTFIGQLGNFGFRVWDRSRESLKLKGLRYYCEGGLRAFSREFTQQFKLPTKSHVGEDSYSFYDAVSRGFKVIAVKEAQVYTDLPKDLSDYVKQMKRFLTDPDMVKHHFPRTLIAKYETLTTQQKLKALLPEFVKSPFIGSIYLVLQTLTNMQMPFYKPPAKWRPVKRSLT